MLGDAELEAILKRLSGEKVSTPPPPPPSQPYTSQRAALPHRDSWQVCGRLVPSTLEEACPLLSK